MSTRQVIVGWIVAACIVFGLCAAASGQEASVTWTDKSVTTVAYGSHVDVGKAHLSFEDWRFILHNGGACDPNPALGARPPRPEPIFFDWLTLTLPDTWTCPLGEVVGARRIGAEPGRPGFSRWVIVAPTDWHLPANAPTDSYPEYQQPGHRVEGGKRVRVDVAPAADPWRLADTTPDAAGRAGCLAVWNPDYALIGRCPGLQHCIRDVWRYSVRSLDPRVTNGFHDKGAMLIPSVFAKRTGIPTDSAATYANPWMIGTKELPQATRAGYYDNVAALAINGLLTNDLGSLLMSRFELLYMIAEGALDVDDPTNPHRGDWCGEWSIGGTLGSSISKQWDMPIAGMAKLWPNDRDIQDWYRKRVARLKMPLQWTFGGGARCAGNIEKDRWFMWRSSGDAGIASAAVNETTRVLTYIGSKGYVPEAPDKPTKCSGGEGWLFTAYARKFAEAGVGAQHAAKLDSMIDFYLTRGGRWLDGTWKLPAAGPAPYWQACYFFDATDPALDEWNGDHSVRGTMPGGYLEEGLFVLPMLKYAQPARAGQVRAIEALADDQFIGGANPWFDRNTSSPKWNGVAVNAVCPG